MEADVPETQSKRASLVAELTVVCAAGNAALDLLVKEKAIERVAELAPQKTRTTLIAWNG